MTAFRMAYPGAAEITQDLLRKNPAGFGRQRGMLLRERLVAWRPAGVVTD